MKLTQCTLILLGCLTVKMVIAMAKENVTEEGSLGFIGITRAKEGEFPHVVMIRQSETFGWVLGSGIIISEDTIATTTNICKNIASRGQERILPGIIYRNPITDKYYEIKKVEIHPGYDPETKEFDVCKITLMYGLSYNKNIQPIKICSWRPESSHECTLAEFGGERGDIHNFNDRMYKQTVWTMNNDDCKREYGNQIGQRELTDSMICSAKKDGSGVCVDASGGAMECHLGGERCLAGIISWNNEPCTGKIKPVVSVDVTHPSVKLFLFDKNC